jgi:hypothetical protein
MATTQASSKGKKRTKKREPSAQEKAAAAFFACGRCSFFLAGYRLIFSDFDEAVEKSKGNYLTLSWNHAVRQLIQESYGSQLEEDAYHFQWSCKECRRAFAFDRGETAENPDTLQVTIKNR